MEDKTTLERIEKLESNQKFLLDLASLYLAHTKANSLAIAALLGSFSDQPQVQERIRWHLNTASDANLREVPNQVYLDSFERLAGHFLEAAKTDPNQTERIRAH